jgi:hypothetical protein
MNHHNEIPYTINVCDLKSKIKKKYIEKNKKLLPYRLASPHNQVNLFLLFV